MLLYFSLLIIVTTLVDCRKLTENQFNRGNNGKLIFSHVIYRHGDRTPAEDYPTDPYHNVNGWPVGWGELTNTGKQQQMDLGSWLRERYGNDLLSDEYSSSDTYVQSTDEDRTLASAYANLAGLYPPKGDQIWNDTMPWQPIPVHKVSEASDFLLAGSVPACPTYQDELNQLMATNEFQRISKKYQPYFQYISQHSGVPLTNPFHNLMLVLLVRDTLFIEDLYNKSLPEWTTKIYPGMDIDKLALLTYVLPSYNTEMAKFRSGYLFKEILDRSTNKTNGLLVPDRSLWMYSTHETVIASFLYALGVFNNDFVQYAACILIELRSTKDGPHIELFYKESSHTDEAIPLDIPHCGYSCPLKKLYTIYKAILPSDDFDVACQQIEITD